MLLNLGLLLLFVLIIAYVFIPPLFVQGRYLEIVRARYQKVLGGEWTLRKRLLIEAGAALIVICLIILLTYLSMR
jgi:hypothetical protein